jgi:prephenate dehydrogenase
LAVQAVAASVARVGIGRRIRSLRAAKAFDAVDEITLDMAKGVAGTDLVIVATPIGRFEQMFAAMAGHLPPGCIVTDVGSTKQDVVRLAHRILPKHVHFVGSHPMAGSEKTGVEFARADLFANAPCVVTKTPQTHPKALATVRQFWSALGAKVITLSPSDHDDLVGNVSHLPHALAAVLVNAAPDGKALSLAGSGFRDTTRIASGDPAMWRDIFMTNRRSTIKALDGYVRELKEFRAALDQEDDQKVTAMLTKAKRRRDAWMAKRLAQQEESG